MNTNTEMPSLLRNRLEDARDTAISNIEFLENEIEKAENKVAALRTQIENHQREIRDNIAAKKAASRLLEGEE